eukprot:2339740-Pyramimonas_sp.AAC.1
MAPSRAEAQWTSKPCVVASALLCAPQRASIRSHSVATGAICSSAHACNVLFDLWAIYAGTDTKDDIEEKARASLRLCPCALCAAVSAGRCSPSSSALRRRISSDRDASQAFGSQRRPKPTRIVEAQTASRMAPGSAD